MKKYWNGKCRVKISALLLIIFCNIGPIVIETMGGSILDACESPISPFERFLDSSTGFYNIDGSATFLFNATRIENGGRIPCIDASNGWIHFADYEQDHEIDIWTQAFTAQNMSYMIVDTTGSVNLTIIDENFLSSIFPCHYGHNVFEVAFDSEVAQYDLVVDSFFRNRIDSIAIQPVIITDAITKDINWSTDGVITSDDITEIPFYADDAVSILLSPINISLNMLYIELDGYIIQDLHPLSGESGEWIDSNSNNMIDDNEAIPIVNADAVLDESAFQVDVSFDDTDMYLYGPANNGLHKLRIGADALNLSQLGATDLEEKAQIDIGIISQPKGDYDTDGLINIEEWISYEGTHPCMPDSWGYYSIVPEVGQSDLLGNWSLAEYTFTYRGLENLYLYFDVYNGEYANISIDGIQIIDEMGPVFDSWISICSFFMIYMGDHKISYVYNTTAIISVEDISFSVGPYDILRNPNAESSNNYLTYTLADNDLDGCPDVYDLSPGNFIASTPSNIQRFVLPTDPSQNTEITIQVAKPEIDYYNLTHTPGLYYQWMDGQLVEIKPVIRWLGNQKSEIKYVGQHPIYDDPNNVITNAEDVDIWDYQYRWVMDGPIPMTTEYLFGRGLPYSKYTPFTDITDFSEFWDKEVNTYNPYNLNLAGMAMDPIAVDWDQDFIPEYDPVQDNLQWLSPFQYWDDVIGGYSYVESWLHPDWIFYQNEYLDKEDEIWFDGGLNPYNQINPNDERTSYALEYSEMLNNMARLEYNVISPEITPNSYEFYLQVPKNHIMKSDSKLDLKFLIQWEVSALNVFNNTVFGSESHYDANYEYDYDIYPVYYVETYNEYTGTITIEKDSYRFVDSAWSLVSSVDTVYNMDDFSIWCADSISDEFCDFISEVDSVSNLPSSELRGKGFGKYWDNSPTSLWHNILPPGSLFGGDAADTVLCYYDWEEPIVIQSIQQQESDKTYYMLGAPDSPIEHQILSNIIKNPVLGSDAILLPLGITGSDDIYNYDPQHPIRSADSLHLYDSVIDDLEAEDSIGFGVGLKSYGMVEEDASSFIINDEDNVQFTHHYRGGAGSEFVLHQNDASIKLCQIKKDLIDTASGTITVQFEYKPSGTDTRLAEIVLMSGTSEAIRLYTDSCNPYLYLRVDTGPSYINTNINLMTGYKDIKIDYDCDSDTFKLFVRNSAEEEYSLVGGYGFTTAVNSITDIQIRSNGNHQFIIDSMQIPEWMQCNRQEQILYTNKYVEKVDVAKLCRIQQIYTDPYYGGDFFSYNNTQFFWDYDVSTSTGTLYYAEGEEIESEFSSYAIETPITSMSGGWDYWLGNEFIQMPAIGSSHFGYRSLDIPYGATAIYTLPSVGSQVITMDLGWETSDNEIIIDFTDDLNHWYLEILLRENSIEIYTGYPNPGVETNRFVLENITQSLTVALDAVSNKVKIWLSGEYIGEYSVSTYSGPGVSGIEEVQISNNNYNDFLNDDAISLVSLITSPLPNIQCSPEMPIAFVGTQTSLVPDSDYWFSPIGFLSSFFLDSDFTFNGEDFEYGRFLSGMFYSGTESKIQDFLGEYRIDGTWEEYAVQLNQMDFSNPNALKYYNITTENWENAYQLPYNGYDNWMGLPNAHKYYSEHVISGLEYPEGLSIMKINKTTNTIIFNGYNGALDAYYDQWRPHDLQDLTTPFMSSWNCSFMLFGLKIILPDNTEITEITKELVNGVWTASYKLNNTQTQGDLSNPNNSYHIIPVGSRIIQMVDVNDWAKELLCTVESIISYVPDEYSFEYQHSYIERFNTYFISDFNQSDLSQGEAMEYGILFKIYSEADFDNSEVIKVELEDYLALTMEYTSIVKNQYNANNIKKLTVMEASLEYPQTIVTLPTGEEDGMLLEVYTMINEFIQLSGLGMSEFAVHQLVTYLHYPDEIDNDAGYSISFGAGDICTIEQITFYRGNLGNKLWIRQSFEQFLKVLLRLAKEIHGQIYFTIYGDRKSILTKISNKMKNVNFFQAVKEGRILVLLFNKGTYNSYVGGNPQRKVVENLKKGMKNWILSEELGSFTSFVPTSDIGKDSLAYIVHYFDQMQSLILAPHPNGWPEANLNNYLPVFNREILGDWQLPNDNVGNDLRNFGYTFARFKYAQGAEIPNPVLMGLAKDCDVDILGMDTSHSLRRLMRSYSFTGPEGNYLTDDLGQLLFEPMTRTMHDYTRQFEQLLFIACANEEQFAMLLYLRPDLLSLYQKMARGVIKMKIGLGDIDNLLSISPASFSLRYVESNYAAAIRLKSGIADGTLLDRLMKEWSYATPANVQHLIGDLNKFIDLYLSSGNQLLTDAEIEAIGVTVKFTDGKFQFELSNVPEGLMLGGKPINMKYVMTSISSQFFSGVRLPGGMYLSDYINTCIGKNGRIKAWEIPNLLLKRGHGRNVFWASGKLAMHTSEIYRKILGKSANLWLDAINNYLKIMDNARFIIDEGVIVPLPKSNPNKEMNGEHLQNLFRALGKNLKSTIDRAFLDIIFYAQTVLEHLNGADMTDGNLAPFLSGGAEHAQIISETRWKTNAQLIWMQLRQWYAQELKLLGCNDEEIQVDLVIMEDRYKAHTIDFTNPRDLWGFSLQTIYSQHMREGVSGQGLCRGATCTSLSEYNFRRSRGLFVHAILNKNHASAPIYLESCWGTGYNVYLLMDFNGFKLWKGSDYNALQISIQSAASDEAFDLVIRDTTSLVDIRSQYSWRAARSADSAGQTLFYRLAPETLEDAMKMFSTAIGIMQSRGVLGDDLADVICSQKAFTEMLMLNNFDFVAYRAKNYDYWRSQGLTDDQIDNMLYVTEDLVDQMHNLIPKWQKSLYSIGRFMEAHPSVGFAITFIVQAIFFAMNYNDLLSRYNAGLMDIDEFHRQIVMVVVLLVVDIVVDWVIRAICAGLQLSGVFTFGIGFLVGTAVSYLIQWIYVMLSDFWAPAYAEIFNFNAIVGYNYMVRNGAYRQGEKVTVEYQYVNRDNNGESQASGINVTLNGHVYAGHSPFVLRINPPPSGYTYWDPYEIPYQDPATIPLSSAYKETISVEVTMGECGMQIGKAYLWNADFDENWHGGSYNFLNNIGPENDDILIPYIVKDLENTFDIPFGFVVQHNITQFFGNMTMTTSGISDADDDDVIQSVELAYGSNPRMPDTDLDEIPDYDEIYTYRTNPSEYDSDNDICPDYDEIYVYGTDPLNPDTDEDGLLDGLECRVLMSNPFSPDSDFDGISDYLEFHYIGSDIVKADTDKDGMSDYNEIILGFDCLNSTDVTYGAFQSQLWTENPSTFSSLNYGHYEGITSFIEFDDGDDPWVKRSSHGSASIEVFTPTSYTDATFHNNIYEIDSSKRGQYIGDQDCFAMYNQWYYEFYLKIPNGEVRKSGLVSVTMILSSGEKIGIGFGMNLENECTFVKRNLFGVWEKISTSISVDPGDGNWGAWKLKNDPVAKTIKFWYEYVAGGVIYNDLIVSIPYTTAPASSDLVAVEYSSYDAELRVNFDGGVSENLGEKSAGKLWIDSPSYGISGDIFASYQEGDLHNLIDETDMLYELQDNTLIMAFKDPHMRGGVYYSNETFTPADIPSLEISFIPVEGFATLKLSVGTWYLLPVVKVDDNCCCIGGDLCCKDYVLTGQTVKLIEVVPIYSYDFETDEEGSIPKNFTCQEIGDLASIHTVTGAIDRWYSNSPYLPPNNVLNITSLISQDNSCISLDFADREVEEIEFLEFKLGINDTNQVASCLININIGTNLTNQIGITIQNDSMYFSDGVGLVEYNLTSAMNDSLAIIGIELNALQHSVTVFVNYHFVGKFILNKPFISITSMEFSSCNIDGEVTAFVDDIGFSWEQFNTERYEGLRPLDTSSNGSIAYLNGSYAETARSFNKYNTIYVPQEGSIHIPTGISKNYYARVDLLVENSTQTAAIEFMDNTTTVFEVKIVNDKLYASNYSQGQVKWVFIDQVPLKTYVPLRIAADLSQHTYFLMCENYTIYEFTIDETYTVFSEIRVKAMVNSAYIGGIWVQNQDAYSDNVWGFDTSITDPEKNDHIDNFRDYRVLIFGICIMIFGLSILFYDKVNRYALKQKRKPRIDPLIALFEQRCNEFHELVIGKDIDDAICNFYGIFEDFHLKLMKATKRTDNYDKIFDYVKDYKRFKISSRFMHFWLKCNVVQSINKFHTDIYSEVMRQKEILPDLLCCLKAVGFVVERPDISVVFLGVKKIMLSEENRNINTNIKE